MLNLRSRIFALFPLAAAVLFCLAITALSPSAGAPAFAASRDYEALLQSAVGRVPDPDELSVVELYGTYSDKSLFVKDIRIEVKDADGTLITSISPENDAGFAPSVILCDFKGGGTDQIFLGINSGGSGGYGYYYVYDVAGGKVSTIFKADGEDREDEEYTAQFADEYKVVVKNSATGAAYTADVSGKGADYLNALYDADGKLIQPVNAIVWPINAVFPYYNISLGRFQLETFRPVSGLYHADGIGNVINLMTFDGKEFVSYYEMLGVNS